MKALVPLMCPSSLDPPILCLPKDPQTYEIRTQERGRLEILDESHQHIGDNESKGLNPIIQE